MSCCFCSTSSSSFVVIIVLIEKENKPLSKIITKIEI